MIKQLLKEGFELKSKGFYKHAIETFYKALELDNDSIELMLEIADSYYLMNLEERALNYIEQILDKEPTHIESLKLLRKIFINKKAWVEAEQTAKNIYCISKNIEDLIIIFDLMNKQGKHNEIFEFETNQNEPDIIYEIARAKFFSNELEEAENLINCAINLKSSNQYRLLKGKILYKQKRKQDCLELLNDIEIEEKNPEILNYIGLVKQSTEEYDEAIKCFKKAIQLNPIDEYYYNCASTYFKMGEISLAQKYYNLAIAKNPDNQIYHFALANLYYSEKHYKRALEELHYDFFEANLLRAIILYDTGYLALAKKILDKLAQERPDDHVVESYKKQIEDELNL